MGTDAWLLAAVRTPFGRYRGGLSHIRTDDLAALPIAELVRRIPALDPARLDDVVLGDTNGAGEDNRNVARMAALLAGLPVTVPGVTVNRLCGSGAEALVHAARSIRTEDATLVLAGGVEGMSRAPFVLPRPDEFLPRRMDMYASTVGWRMVNERFPARWTRSLGECAESIAAEYRIGRAEQDAWALRSHQRAHAAWKDGRHADYVMPVGELHMDESIRPDTSAAALAALAPAFTPDGAVTAGNSSPLNDGAIAVLIGSREAAAELGLQPIGRLVASAVVATEPDRFSIAPVGAIEKVLAKTGRTFAELDLAEINEAFAAMVLSCLHDLPDLDPQRLNVHGGAIAYGHPLGASAARVVVDLCRELGRRGGGLGVAAACIGVGLGIAILCEV
ncbi:MAG TPA: thiolase family protein [Actinomycetes bacterium]|nr:thiolase family protein [Actinomycetes bacterium]